MVVYHTFERILTIFSSNPKPNVLGFTIGGLRVNAVVLDVLFCLSQDNNVLGVYLGWFG